MTIFLNEVVRSLGIWTNIVSKKQQPYVDPDLDPVLLVPGIAGSILNAVDGEGSAERVWVRIVGADHTFRTKMWSRFDPSTGQTVCLDPTIHISVPEERYGLYAIDVLDPDMIIGRDTVYYFHEMIVEMVTWGFQEGKSLFGFGYDFRQSNRFQETLEQFARKLELVYKASGGRKINIISHSMGGLLVKCFMCLHSNIFEKYVQNWMAIATPFRGAPGYVTSTLLNGMSFVEGWARNFFISKWSMHQLLIECPSVYELIACPEFQWHHNPVLEVWRQKHNENGDCMVFLETYSTAESISILEEALSSNSITVDGVHISLPFNKDILNWTNETRKILSCAKVPSSVNFYNIYATGLETPHSVCYGSDTEPVSSLQELPFFQAKYICVDGDGTVPAESAKADGLCAKARVGIPGEHRGILCDHHVFRILKHWLKAGEPDPYYNPLNDYVVLPTAHETTVHQATSLGEDWDIVPTENDWEINEASSISIAGSKENEYSRSEADTGIIVHSQNEGKQHVRISAVSRAAEVW